MQEMQELPWYRQFWPWFIMSIPAVSVIGGFVSFYLAGGEPSMVVDDYGHIAMATVQRAELSRRAEQLGLNARVVMDQGAGLVTVTLGSNAGFDQWPDGLVLRLTHPTLRERDRKFELAELGGLYTARFERPPGRYYVSLSDTDETWRLTGELFDGASVIELRGAGRID